MQAYQPRGAPNGVAPDAAQRPRSSGRNVATMSRAEKFEDEKRRIIDSCFMRRESDGSIAESYITHIRITEDASSPSAPPPPNSTPENKKARAIIVAVRKSGRVRLHKARENNNGTFSIGKTWVLDHLSAIESYTGATPTNYEERQRKEWAGATGMLITIQKPYFWQTVTAKEKDFFIGSLVKIYRKYTGGSEPQLSGFTESELADFSAAPHRSNGSHVPSQAHSQPPAQSHTPQSDASEMRESRPTLSDYRTSDPRSTNGKPSFQGRPDSSGSTSTRNTDHHGHATHSALGVPDANRTARVSDPRDRIQALRKDSTGHSSKPDLQFGSPRDDQSARTITTASSVESLQSRPEAQTPPPVFANADRLKPNGSYSPLSRNDSPATPPLPGPRSPERNRIAPSGAEQSQLPERKRPPLMTTESNQRPSGKGTPLGFVTPKEAPSPTETHPSKPPNLSDIVVPKSALEYFSAERGRQDNPEVETKEEVRNEKRDKPGLKGIHDALQNLSPPGDDSSPAETPDEEMHRPGLGPMIKKKSPRDVAGLFRKAATAHNAFKPRAGGAADKIRAGLTKSPEISDGINGVFPAPAREPKTPMVQPAPSIHVESPPAVSPPVADPISVDSLDAAATTLDGAKETSRDSPEKPPPEPRRESLAVQEERRVRRPSNNSAKYAKALGIDPILLDGRTSEIDSVLNDHGWQEANNKKKTFEDLHADLRRELAKVETGSWLGGFEQNDDRISAVGRLLDKAIAECEELDSVLTLYNVELGTLSEDVAYIEAQSQGLQVQTANQKLLHNELKNLLDTITLSSSQLRALKDAPINRPDGVDAIEKALVQLYKAMLTIDPKIRLHNQAMVANGQASTQGGTAVDRNESEISTMRAVQERRDGYRHESISFIHRFKQFVQGRFQKLESQTAESIARSQPLGSANSKIDFHRREHSRGDLITYAPLVLFTREIDSAEWDGLLKSYEASVKKPYQEEFRHAVSSWRSVAKKATGDELDALFTSQEKEPDSLVARKLTVKRSKTLREGPRTASGDKNQEGKIVAYEAFAGLLKDTSQAIFIEQNFVVEMFHLSSLTSNEFSDVVATAPPEERRLGSLTDKKLFDPDRNAARRLRTMMDDIFAAWPVDLQSAVDWVISQDALQGIGVMLALETRIGEFEDSNQEYLVQTLQQIHSRLTTRFDRFVDEQIRGIEETKVKIKKRKGVIAFMKTFPLFASTVESMLATPNASRYEIRHLVNDVYIKINNAMFESLKFIAKESPVVMAGQKTHGPTSAAGVGADAEDKEVLNYHILLIENMHHYLEEVDGRSNPVLAEWKETALREMTEHLDLYLDAVVRRPLGKLLDFLESTESLIAAAGASGADPAAIAERASHARPTFRKLLGQFDAREVAKGVEALKKRVVKHFGEADDPGLSQSLIVKVLRECAERYVSVWDRTQRVIRDVYGGGLEIEWRREEVQAMFRRA